MSRMKKIYCAAARAAVGAFAGSLQAWPDDNKDDYVKGTSAGKELGQTVAADDIFTLSMARATTMNPLIATNTNNQLVCCLVYEKIVEVDNSFEGSAQRCQRMDDRGRLKLDAQGRIGTHLP